MKALRALVEGSIRRRVFGRKWPQDPRFECFRIIGVSVCSDSCSIYSEVSPVQKPAELLRLASLIVCWWLSPTICVKGVEQCKAFVVHVLSGSSNSETILRTNY